MPADQQWFRRFHPDDTGARVRLICFPHAGGAASAFAPWAAPLADAVDLVGVRYPAREDRLDEAPARSLHDLARGVADGVRAAHEADPEPVAFFGHSMGASVAFETALLLAGEECAPDLVVVSARQAPARVGTPGAPVGDAELEELIISLDPRNRDVLDVNELRELVWPAIRSDFDATRVYQPTDDALACDLLAMGGASDSRVSFGDIVAWQSSTTAEFRARLYGGGHFYFADDTEKFLAELRNDLLRAVDSRRGSHQSTLIE